MERDLETYQANGELDGLGLYLYGVVLKEMGRKEAAKK